MEPKPGQDVSRPYAVHPLFSGDHRIAALVSPPDRDDITFTEEDREAVEAVIHKSL